MRKTKSMIAAESAVKVVSELENKWGISPERLFSFVESSDKYKSLFNDGKLCDEVVEGIVAQLHGIKTDSECNRHYNNQASVVVRGLMDEKRYGRLEALELWYTSKTRDMIQKERKMAWVSGARCYDELLMELNGDWYWMKGQFD